MGYFGALLAALTVLSVVSAEEGCPPPSDISPCTCDGEGVSCMRAKTLDQIKKAFRANYPEGGGLYVYIQGTPIIEIPADLFNDYKAENFYIEVNKINKVDLRCFDHTRKYLKSISFFGNELTNFNYSYFQNSPDLWNLNLGRNKIRSVPSNAIAHNSLGSIILAENEISSIGQNAFLNCPNLRRLDLSNNKLTSLGDYAIALTADVPGLQINLAGNEISTISRTAFQNASPQILFLSLNKLTYLKQEVFGPLLNSMAQHGGILEVSGNPFTCKGCNNYEWVVTNKFVLARMIAGFVCPDLRTGIAGLTRTYVGC